VAKTYKLKLEDVVVDTREQTPLWLESNGVFMKSLSTGDYSVKGYEDRIAIERKGLQDVFSSIGKGRKRFWRGIRRLASMRVNGGFGGVIVEGTRTQVKDFFSWGKVHRNQVLGTLERIQVEYGVPVAHVDCEKNYNEARMVTKIWLRMAVEKVEGYTAHSLDDICLCGQGGPVKEHDRRRKLFGCHD